jgi:hypothetical protein
MSTIVKKGRDFEISGLLTRGRDFMHFGLLLFPIIKGVIFLLWESVFHKGRYFQGGETLDVGAFASCVESFASF